MKKIILFIKKIFCKKQKTEEKHYSINNNLLKYLEINCFFIHPFNNYMGDEKEWKKIFNNFSKQNLNNYFGTIVYTPNNAVFSGYDNLINLYILLKAFFDSLTENNREQYESLFRSFFIYAKNSNEQYLKIQKSTYSSDLRKIVNFIDGKITRMNIETYKKINETSSELLLCYKYFFEQFSSLNENEIFNCFEYLFSDDNKMVIFKPFAENKTFKNSAMNTSLNACVGTNGWNDINNYIYGYKRNVEYLYENITKCDWDIDGMVYPLCFSARHFIELSLKNIVHLIDLVLKEIKGIVNDDLDNKLKKTHNLNILYELSKSLAFELDSRMEIEILKLQQYINDFSNIDSTGETFRYPFNQHDEHSLDDLSCINLVIFYTRFTELSEIIEQCSNCVLFLIHEYSTKTYYKNYGRNVIEKISDELPDYSTWRQSSFDVIKMNIIAKYSLKSKKELYGIIDIIKQHPEFSSKIGIENKISELTKETYNLYLFIALNGDIDFTTTEICNEINNIFNINELRILYSFFEISKPDYYSEEFKGIYENSKEIDIFTLVSYLFYNPKIKILKINDGIKKCGQLYLL